jgi:hypothetical protein
VREEGEIGVEGEGGVVEFSSPGVLLLRSSTGKLLARVTFLDLKLPVLQSLSCSCSNLAIIS